MYYVKHLRNVDLACEYSIRPTLYIVMIFLDSCILFWILDVIYIYVNGKAYESKKTKPKDGARRE
jgi:uncharacterized membrane protein